MIELPAWSELSVGLTAPQARAAEASGLVSVQLDDPPDRWRLVADSRVGVVLLDDGLELRVTPKLAIPQLMFLLSYATDPRGWRDIGPTYAVTDDLFAAVASAFAAHAERSLAPAPLRGYVSVEERAITLRGRLRIGDQIARWPAQPIPLEITHDDFSADIAENRFLRGAAELLLRMPLVPVQARRRLLRIRATLEDVLPHAPSASARAPALTRVNARYGSALALAELILRSASISTGRGSVVGVSFVFDMNQVFEDFLSRALKIALERHGGRVLLQHGAEHLDVDRRIRLIPDLTWWREGACRAVIDAKYKPLIDRRFPNADAYQMLAYCTALDLDRGYLVYAKDSGEAARDHVVRHAGTVIHVRAVDVERQPAQVLAQVDDLARAIAAGAQPSQALTTSSAVTTPSAA